MKIQLLLLVLAVAGSNIARADFADNHPRRAQVNNREARQNARITNGLANGSLTSAQAQALQADEARIKSEEVSEVQANGGYLTQAQRQQLNSELNSESQTIYAERHPAAVATPTEE